MRTRLSRILRRLAIGLAAAAALAAIMAVAGEKWVIPAVVRWQLCRQLEQSWDGRAVVESVDFSFLGPTVVRGLELRDASGRQWAQADEVVCGLSGWPGMRPRLTNLKFEGLRVVAHFDGGGCRLPLKVCSGEGSPGSFIDVQRILAPSAMLSMSQPDGRRVDWRGMDVIALCRGDRIEFQAGDSLSGQDSSLQGTIDFADGRVVMDVQYRLPVINWFVHAKDKFFRMRFRGRWDQPSSLLLAKEPAKNPTESTAGVFADAARDAATAGQAAAASQAPALAPRNN